MRNKKIAARPSQSLHRQPFNGREKPFIARAKALRRRFFLLVLSIGIFGGIASFFQAGLARLLLLPAGNLPLIYSPPAGSFELQFCLCAGLVASVPSLMYHLFTYIYPSLGQESKRFLRICVFASGGLVLVGLLFGYRYGLPASAHFLLQSFSGEQIKVLISTQSYLYFALAYLLGTALIFQIPLILVLINRIKPLRSRTLLRQQRWVVVGVFIFGAIISITPDIRNQLLLSLPVITTYPLAIGIIRYTGLKRRRSKKVLKLRETDLQNQILRQEQFRQAQQEWEQLIQKMRTAASRN